MVITIYLRSGGPIGMKYYCFLWIKVSKIEYATWPENFFKSFKEIFHFIIIFIALISMPINGSKRSSNRVDDGGGV